jgi:hypothetical protein
MSTRLLPCILCHEERPVDDLTMAEDAAGEPFGPICMATAPGTLSCLAEQDLRDRWATALRLRTKLYLEREDVEAMRDMVTRAGWVA